MNRTPQSGFTLAELLIALAILGEIATFAIPKILTAQQSGQNRAIAKEAIGMLSGAVQKAQLSTDASTAISAASLTQYMNYINVDSTNLVDAVPNDSVASYNCNSYTCIKLHSGATLLLTGSVTGSTGVFSALIDPNGYQGQKDSLIFYVFGTGRLMSADDYLGTTTYTPSWFSW